MFHPLSLEHQFDPIRSQSNGPSVSRFGILKNHPKDVEMSTTSNMRIEGYTLRPTEANPGRIMGDLLRLNLRLRYVDEFMRPTSKVDH